MDEHAEDQEFYEDEPWDGISKPTPEQFEDYNEFTEALTDYKIQKTMPPVQAPHAAPAPEPDDDHRALREAKAQEVTSYRKKAILAASKGDFENVDRYNNLARWAEKDLEKIPKSKGQQMAEDADYNFGEQAIEQLFDADKFNDPVWESPEMQHDAAIYISEHNARARKYIRLPLEDSPHGNVQPAKPSTIVRFSLSPDVLKQFQTDVYGMGSGTPDEIFRRSWNWLHRSGYGSRGELAVKPKTEKPKKKKAKHSGFHDGMTQKEFERLREQQGARRH